MQGMELGLRAMAAGGAALVATLQGGPRETTRYEPERDLNGAMSDPAALEAYLAGVRKQGALLSPGKPHPKCWQGTHMAIGMCCVQPWGSDMAHVVDGGAQCFFMRGQIPHADLALTWHVVAWAATAEPLMEMGAGPGTHLAITCHSRGCSLDGRRSIGKASHNVYDGQASTNKRLSLPQACRRTA